MLVSVHIPKTGGSSLRRSVLEPFFGDRLLLDYDDAPLSHDAAERNGKALAWEPSPDLLDRYDCVHGHFLATKYLSANVPCRFAVWFRDPEQRVLSRFHYGKRSETPGNIFAPEMTLQEFCEIDRFHNVYAKYLWNFDLERFDFIGITERYASGMEVFGRLFDIPGARRVAIANANPAKPAAAPYGVDDATRALIRRTNREDFEIYEAARAINRRLQCRYLGP